MTDVDAARITHADRSAKISHADRAAPVSHAVANQSAEGPLLDYLQFFADYESWQAGDPLPNRWDDNSGIKDLTDNNTVGQETSSPLVGSKSGHYTSSNREYHQDASFQPALDTKDYYLICFYNADSYGDITLAGTFGNNGGGVIFGLFSGGRIEQIDSGGSNVRVTTSLSLNSGSTHMMEGWRTGGELHLRIDDGTVESTPITGATAGSSGFGIGARPNGDKSFGGLLDMVAVEVAPAGGLQWPSESTRLYNDGNGRSWDEIKTYQP